MNLQSPVTALLNREQITYNVITIPLSDDQKPIRSLETLLLEHRLNPESIVRSILFKTASDQFVLLALASGDRADWAVLRSHLNERKCRMAEFDEVSQATGYVVGAVPPIALPAQIKVLVDHSINAYEDVVIGSGVLGYAISLKSKDLLKLLVNAEFGKFTSAT